MPETPVLDLPYPAAVGVAPDVPYWQQQLAEAVEAAILAERTSVNSRIGSVMKRGYLEQNANASGLVVITHNLGVIPDQVLLSACWYDNAILNVLKFAEDRAARTTTTATVRCWRTDTNAVFPGPKRFEWQASKA